METGSDSRRVPQHSSGQRALGRPRRKYLLLPGEQGGSRVRYKRLPRGWLASALSGRAVRVCQTDLCARVLSPVPAPYSSLHREGGPLASVVSLSKNAASSWVVVLGAEGPASALDCCIQEKVRGRKERRKDE